MTIDKRRNLALVALVAAVVLAVGGGAGVAAFGQDGQGPADAVQEPTPMSEEVGAAFAAFSDTGPADANTVQTRERLREEFNTGPAESPVAHADFEQAQPVDIAGSELTAWIAPSGDQVCTFIPDPAGGDGASCADMGLIESEQGITLMGGGPGLRDQVIVVVLVPDGGAAPWLDSADGGSSAIAVDGNAAAVLAPASASLRTAAVEWPLERFTIAPGEEPSGG